MTLIQNTAHIIHAPSLSHVITRKSNLSGTSEKLAYQDELLYLAQRRYDLECDQKHPPIDAAKAILLKKCPRSAHLMSKFPGLYDVFHSFNKAQATLNIIKEIVNKHFVPSSEEIEEIIRIAKMRHIDLTITQKLEKHLDRPWHVLKIVKYIQCLLDELSHPNSQNVVRSPDGSATFGFGAGWAGHTIGLQFKRNADGSYSFFIHNRGYKNDDSRIHGSLKFKYKEYIYRKTSVEIKADLATLKNKNFLKNLIRARDKNCGHSFYNCIYNFFVVQKNGTIIKSENEIELEKLIKEYGALSSLLRNIPNTSGILEDLQKKIHKKLKDSSEFHTCQLYRTCVEANRSALERGLAKKRTRRIVRLHTMQAMIQELNKIKFQKSFPTKTQKRELNRVICKGRSVISDLNMKLTPRRC